MTKRTEATPIVIGILVYLLFTVLPLFHLNLALDIGLVPRFLFLAVLLLIAMAAATPKTISFLGLCLASYYLWECVSLFWARNKAEGLFEIQRTFLVFASYLIISTLLQDERAEKTLFKAVLYSTIILLAVGFAQLIALPSLDVRDSYEIFGLQGHKNLFASFLFLSVPYLLLGFLSASSNLWRVLFIASTLASTVLLYFIQTRAVYVGMAATAVVFSIAYVLSTRTFHHSVFIKSVSFIAVAAVLICMIVFAKNRYGPKKENEKNEMVRSKSTEERIQLLVKTKVLIEQHWLLGVGSGNWQVEFPRNGIDGLVNAQLKNTTFQRPHNDFLWVWAETGIIGLLLIIGFYGCLLVGTIQSIRKKNAEEKQKMELLVLSSFLIGYLLISFLDFPKERIEHGVFLMGLVVLIGKRSEWNMYTKQPQPLNYPSKTVLIGLLLLSLIIGIYRLKGEYYTKKVYIARATANWSLLTRFADKATSFFYTLDPTSVPIAWYRGVANFSLGKKELALQDFEAAYRYNPWNFHILNNLASAYETLGEHELAKEKYWEAIRINPLFDEARLNLFVIYYNEKDFSTCWKLIEACVENSERKKIYLQLLNQTIKK